MRYVERKALRAHRVEAAESWRWGNLRRRVQHVGSPLLGVWPLAEPRHWVKWVNQPEAEAGVQATGRSIPRGRPKINPDNFTAPLFPTASRGFLCRPTEHPPVAVS